MESTAAALIATKWPPQQIVVYHAPLGMTHDLG